MPQVPRGSGNGRQTSFNVRGLLTRHVLGLPRGPFSVAQLINVLESFDYHAEPRAPDEVLMFHRTDRERPIPVDPDWQDFWEDSGIFNCIRTELRLTAAELADFLDATRR